MKNAQAALIAANAKKYSIMSFDDEIKKTLDAADRFLSWLNSKEAPELDTSLPHFPEEDFE